MIALTELEEALQAASILRDEVKRQAIEIERLRAAYDKLLADTPNFRNTTIEECARVAEDMLNHKPHFKYVSDAIRALKDKP